MTDTCVRGCKVRASHVPPCICTSECDPAHDDHCRGCLPATAVDGLLCRCSHRIREALGAPPLNGLTVVDRDEPARSLRWCWEHLATLRPDMDASGGEGRSGGSGVSDREAERLASVLSLRTEIRDWLAISCAELSERINLPYPAQLRLSTDYRVRPLAVEPKPWDTDQEARDYAVVHHCQAFLARHVDALLAGSGWPDPWTAAESVIDVYEALYRKRELVTNEALGVRDRVIEAGLMSQARSLLRWDVEIRRETDPCPLCSAPRSVAVRAGTDAPQCLSCKAVLDPGAWSRWKTWRQSVEGTG